MAQRAIKSLPQAETFLHFAMQQSQTIIWVETQVQSRSRQLNTICLPCKHDPTI